MNNKIFDLTYDNHIKNQKVQEIVLYVLSFLFIPAFNIGLSFASDESPIFTSFSRMAWVKDLLYLMIIVILVNAAVLFYALYQTLKKGQYSKKASIFFYSFVLVGVFVALIGSCIPAYYLPENTYYTALRTAHATLVGLGLGILYIATLLISITTLFKNKKKGIIEVVMTILALIIAALLILFVNDKNSYCTTSALTQALIMFILVGLMTAFSIFNSNKKDAE